MNFCYINDNGRKGSVPHQRMVGTLLKILQHSEISIWKTFWTLAWIKIDNIHVALNGGRGVGAHGSWQRAGCVPATGSLDFLWLSLTQITESCIWEPWTGSPAIPKLGTIGTQQDSRCYLALFACRAASGLNIGLVSGARLVPHSSWVLALWLLFAGVWIEWPFLHGRKNFCSYKAILRFLWQKTQRS